MDEGKVGPSPLYIRDLKLCFLGILGNCCVVLQKLMMINLSDCGDHQALPLISVI